MITPKVNTTKKLIIPAIAKRAKVPFYPLKIKGNRVFNLKTRLKING